MSRTNGPVAICVINLKGGVGKSTISALLSRHAIRRGLDTLAIDIDPQANLSQALLGRGYKAFLDEMRPSIVELFNGYLPPTATAPSTKPLTPNAGLETIATNGAATLQLIPSRFDFSHHLTNAVRPDPRVLARHVSTNFHMKDLIIIDCAPTESTLTHAAYHASGLVLVPVKPEFFATIGFPLLQQSLTDFRSSNRGHKIEVAGVVINNAFYDGGNNGGPEKLRSQLEIAREAAKNSWHIFDEQIPFSRGFPKMMRGDFSYPGNAATFSRFANEFFTKVGL